MTENENQNEQWMSLVLALNKIRLQKRIATKKIAEIAGMKPEHLSRFINCKSPPTLRTFLKIGNAVGVNFFLKDKDF
jgi:DNA-binding phage protein